MSLLADLLSKIKQPPSKREVAPNLKNIVQGSARQATRTKIIILSVILIVFIAAGMFTVFFVKSIEQSAPGITRVDPGMRADMQRPETAAGIQAKAVLDKSDKTATTAAAVRLSAAGDAVRQSAVIEESPVPPAPAKGAAFRKEDASETEDIAQESGRDEEQQAEDEDIPNSDRSGSHDVDAFLYSAREHELKGDYTRALADYKKVLEIDSRNVPVINNIAYMYLQMGLTEESIMHAERALELDSDYTPSLVNIGIAYAKSQKVADAEVYFKKALSLEPDNRMVLLNLAILNERQKYYNDASKYYTVLAKLGSLEGLMGQARIYENRNRTEDAVALYRRAFDHTDADDNMKVKLRQRIMLLLNNPGLKPKGDTESGEE